VVTIGVPPSFYVDQLRDIASFKSSSQAVKAIGVFSTPARVGDLAGLSLDSTELGELARCRPSACSVQLSVEGIERIRRVAAEGRGDAKANLERTFREILVDLVNGYRERGNAALMTYVDDERPLSAAAAFRRMMASPPAILDRWPSLSRHVSSFPRESSDVEDIVYWSKEKLGPVVVISVTHLAIERVGETTVEAFAAASKQIYGSHYFDSSLGITVVVGAGGLEGRPRSLLAYANRSRLDALGGIWGRLKRAVVRSRARTSLGRSLDEARLEVERRYEAQPRRSR
jgi:hypothetical protein